MKVGLLLQRHLRGSALGLEVPFLHGGVSRTTRLMVAYSSGVHRSAAVDHRAEGGGTGLNLTAASQVAILLTTVVESTVEDRSHRPGPLADRPALRSMSTHKMICQGTVEERIRRESDR